MLRKLFGGKKRKQIDDKIFGRLIFYPATEKEESYWFTTLKFGPQQEEIDCTIYNEEKGITTTQRNFYLQIERKYPDLVARIEEFINTELGAKGWKGQRLILEQDLEFIAITIPQNINKSEIVNWEIDYREIRGFTNFKVELKN